MKIIEIIVAISAIIFVINIFVKSIRNFIINKDKGCCCTKSCKNNCNEKIIKAFNEAVKNEFNK